MVTLKIFPRRIIEKLSCGIFFVVLLTSCATIIHTPYQKVTIIAEPKGTSIYINHQFKGKDSVQVTLKRNSNAYIELKHDYCIHKEILLTPPDFRNGTP